MPRAASRVASTANKLAGRGFNHVNEGQPGYDGCWNPGIKARLMNGRMLSERNAGTSTNGWDIAMAMYDRVEMRRVLHLAV